MFGESAKQITRRAEPIGMSRFTIISRAREKQTMSAWYLLAYPALRLSGDILRWPIEVDAFVVE